MPTFAIRWGIPEPAGLWEGLCAKAEAGDLHGNEKKLFKKLFKFAEYLANNTRHPGLRTHPISDLSDRIGRKVWQSYLENRTPAAGRAFWVYGPDEQEITVLAIEPHPEDRKSRGYASVRLADVGTKRRK